MDAEHRKDILTRYLRNSRRFDEAATRRRDVDPPENLSPATQAGVGDPELTSRESEILQLIADGLGNRQIGARVSVAEETVKTHVRHLLAKLNARQRANAVAIGFRRGLIV